VEGFGPVQRTAFASAELPDGHIFVTCGYDSANTVRLKDAWILDTDGMSWTQMADAPFALEAPTGAYLNGKVYIFGGVYGSGTNLDHVLVYDIASDAWSHSSNLPMVGFFMRSVAVDDRHILLVGGDTDSTLATDECYLFDADTELFSDAAPLPEPRGGGGVAILGGTVYYAGGWDDYYTLQGEIFAYDVAGDEWTEVGEMPSAMLGMACVGSHLGLMYMIGGGTDLSWYGANVDRAMAWDPEDGRFIELPGLLDPVRYSAAFELPDGRILFLGGHDNTQGSLYIYSLPGVDLEAGLDADSAAQGDGVWVEVRAIGATEVFERISGTLYLWRDNVTWGSWNFASIGGTEVMVNVQVPEDAPAGEYYLVFDFVRLDSTVWNLASLELTVTEAPSTQETIQGLQEQNDALQEQLDDLEQQNQDLSDELAELKEANDAKLDAMIGYGILILALVGIAIAVVALVRKK
jgi:hypothetical protein